MAKHNMHAHIGPELRASFHHWRDLHTYFEESSSPHLTGTQIARQVLMADVFAQLDSLIGCTLAGTLGTPASMADSSQWNSTFRAPSHPRVQPYYLVGKSASDMDVIISDTSPDDPLERYHDQALALLSQVTTGLGGLVSYSLDDVRLEGEEQRLVTQFTAHPADGSASITIEIEFKRPAFIPAYRRSEPAKRSIIPLDVPGIAAIMPNLYPASGYVADNLAELVLAPENMDPTHWRGHKLIFNSYCRLMTHQLALDDVSEALSTGRHAEHLSAGELPTPFTPFNHPDLDWEKGYELARSGDARLGATYPGYATALATITRFATALRERPGALWRPAQGVCAAPVKPPAPPARPQFGRRPTR